METPDGVIFLKHLPPQVNTWIAINGYYVSLLDLKFNLIGYGVETVALWEWLIKPDYSFTYLPPQLF